MATIEEKLKAAKIASGGSTTTQQSAPKVSDDSLYRSQPATPTTQKTTTQPTNTKFAPGSISYQIANRDKSRETSNIEQTLAKNSQQNVNKAQTTAMIEPTAEEKKQTTINSAINLADSLFNQNDELAAITNAEAQVSDAVTSFTQQMQDFLKQQYESTSLNVEELFNSTVDTEALNQLEQQAIDRKKEIDDISSQIRATEMEVRAELGNNATEWQVQRNVASRVKELNNQRDYLINEYNAIQGTFQAQQEDAIQMFNLKLQDKQFQVQRQDQLVQQSLGISREAFNQQMTLAMRGLDRAEKEYWNNKQFDDQLRLMEIEDSNRKEFMTWEYNWKKETGQLDKDNTKRFQNSDWTVVWLNTDTWEFEYNFDPQAIAWFQFNMDIERTWNNVAVDTNNPWNITASNWWSPTQTANYWRQIGATWTYKSPNGRTYYYFDSVEAGAAALRRDVKMKQQGKSSWATPDTTLGDFILWYSKWPGYIWTGTQPEPYYMQAIVEHIGGNVQNIDLSLPIKYIDPDKLANAVAFAETWWKMDITGQWYNVIDTTTKEFGWFTPIEVRRYNSSKWKDFEPWTKDFLEANKFYVEKNNVMYNPYADIEDILYYSQWSWPLVQAQETKLLAYSDAFTGIEELRWWLDGEEWWVLLGRLKSMNPYDVNAQVINNLLTSITPGIARGVYGEVGVLTDSDIERYKATLPNLTQPKDLQQAVLALNIKRLMNWYKNSLRTFAAGDTDVNWYVWTYRDLEQRYEAIMNQLWWTPNYVSWVWDVIMYWNNMSVDTWAYYPIWDIQSLNFTPYFE